MNTIDESSRVNALFFFVSVVVGGADVAHISYAIRASYLRDMSVPVVVGVYLYRLSLRYLRFASKRMIRLSICSRSRSPLDKLLPSFSQHFNC